MDTHFKSQKHFDNQAKAEFQGITPEHADGPVDIDLVDVDSDDAPLTRRPKVAPVDVDPVDTPNVRETSSEKEARLRAARIAARTHFYEICQHAFGKARGLTVHLESQNHKANIAAAKSGGVPAAPAVTLDDVRKAAVDAKEQRIRWEAANVAQKKYFCDICDYSAPTQADLNTHLQRKKHTDNVATLAAGGVIAAPKKVLDDVRKARNARNIQKRAAVIASKEFFCSPCQLACGGNSELQNHIRTPKHARNVAMAETTTEPS